ncbi:PadR family transcriptional regulator [Azospirillum griseum]|uniref:PadR family transcriptional regulator n=1 Tax=Azospirillum griseum TaxID=2496639 RepID=A0A431VDM9_9PROT|nr:PadR family transcriptional regulator [Azospirillum griseum]RTR17197.1 PadR family transcriptional regulator [Azospirillum griseum]
MLRHMFSACGRRFSRPESEDDDGRGFGRGRHGHRGGRGGFGGPGGGPGGWGPDGFGGPERGERRVFGQGDLRLVLLWLIEEKPRSGYDLIKSIEEMVNGAYSPSPGVIYPTLTLLEEQGHIRVAATEGNKKLYELTTEGGDALKASATAVAAIRERIDHARARHRGERAPQIVRAVQNFKLALSLRLSRGDLTPEQTDAIAAAIDAAALAVERS